jgi:chlorophyllide a oxygenase
MSRLVSLGAARLHERAVLEGWYPVLLSRDLGRGEVVGVELWGQRRVLFRDAEGRARCLDDVCPHRAAPLSQGRVVDGCIECPYHGWRFDGAGACRRIPTLPAGKTVPQRAAASPLPLVEADELLWVWAGAPDHADASAVPRHPEVGDRAFTRVDMHFDLEVDHELMIENLLDPSHLPFTHDGTLSRRDAAEPLSMTLATTPAGFVGESRRSARPQARAQRFTFLGPCSVRLDLGSERRSFIQLHHCVPLDPQAGRMRLITRMLWRGVPRVPGMAWLTRHYSRRIVRQDLALLRGQAERIASGAEPWGCPVASDRIALEYRRWKQRQLEASVERRPDSDAR